MEEEKGGYRPSARERMGLAAMEEESKRRAQRRREARARILRTIKSRLTGKSPQESHPEDSPSPESTETSSS